MSRIKIRDAVVASITEHQTVAARMTALADVVAEAAERVRATVQAGNRVFICGNGGSAADAQHFAAELTGRFERERRALPALALTTDTSALTAIGNDYGFEHVFSRQLDGLGERGDLLIAISTSGNSPNVREAVKAGKAIGIGSIGLLGRDGGMLAGEVDFALVVPAARTARVQEMHILILHLICEAIDQH